MYIDMIKVWLYIYKQHFCSWIWLLMLQPINNSDFWICFYWNLVRIDEDIPWILKINQIHQNIPHLEYFPKRQRHPKCTAAIHPIPPQNGFGKGGIINYQYTRPRIKLFRNPLSAKNHKPYMETLFLIGQTTCGILIFMPSITPIHTPVCLKQNALRSICNLQVASLLLTPPHPSFSFMKTTRKRRIRMLGGAGTREGRLCDVLRWRGIHFHEFTRLLL